MARFKNVSGTELLLFARQSQADSFQVPPDGIVDIPGEVTAETDDAYVVGDGDEARAWPMEFWKLTKADDTGTTDPHLDERASSRRGRTAERRAADNTAEGDATAADESAQADENSAGSTANREGE